MSSLSLLTSSAMQAPRSQPTPSPASTRPNSPKGLKRRKFSFNLGRDHNDSSLSLTTMSRTGIQRSYSQSHAHSYSVSHTVPSLGQGATVVRTPQDATMCMAKPGATNNPFPISRGASLREAPRVPRRPSLPSPPTLPAELSPRISRPPSGIESSSFATDLGAALDSPRSPPHTPSNLDIDAAYQQRTGRRLTGRTSCSTLVPGRQLTTTPLGFATNTNGMPSPSTPTPVVHRAASRPDLHAAHKPSGPVPASPGPVPSPMSPPARMPAPPLIDWESERMEVLQETRHEAPFTPILISHTTRPATGAASIVLVTLRFGFSLDAEPNTHSVTVTLDTLRPAGGRLVDFIDAAMRPESLAVSRVSRESCGGVSIGCTEGGLEMTDGSSAEDSDFEYDDTRLHPMLQEEYRVALALSAAKPDDVSPTSSRGATRPARRQYPPTAFTPSYTPSSGYSSGGHSAYSSASHSGCSSNSHSGYAGNPSPTATSPSGLPSLSSLPAALAQYKAQQAEAARAEIAFQAAADAAAAEAAAMPLELPSTLPLAIRRPRAATCPQHMGGTVSELTLLIQRDAGAWHAIASRLCSGSWPLLDGRRRRVEDECRWAEMDGLLTELHVPVQAPRGRYI